VADVLQEGEVRGVIGIGKGLGKIETGDPGQIPEEEEFIFSPGVQAGDDPGIALGNGLESGGNKPIGLEILM
jgi:hypothetical protein